MFLDLIDLQTHALVQFKVDGYAAVVPFRKAVGSSTLKEGDECEVL